MVRQVPLTRDQVALVDDEDYERVAAFRWQADRHQHTWYAVANAGPRRKNGRRAAVYLHRFILDTPPDVEVDHRNRQGLDCQRHNLRSATRAQNCMNQGLRRDNTSGFKGVHFDRRGGRWRAQINWEGVRRDLGGFDAPEDAARAYDAKAREMYGEFACPNFPEAT